MAGLDPQLVAQARAIIDDPKVPDAKKAALRAIIDTHADPDPESPLLDPDTLGDVYDESDKRAEALARQKAGLDAQMSAAKAQDDAYAAEHPTRAKLKKFFHVDNETRTGLGLGFDRNLMQSMADNGDPGAANVAAAPKAAEKVSGAATAMGLGALLGPGSTLARAALNSGLASAGGAFAGSRVAGDPLLETAKKTGVAGGTGAIMGTVAGLPAAAMRKLRANPVIGEDIRRAEGQGYSTTLGGGMKRSDVEPGPRPLEREAANVAPEVEQAVTKRDMALAAKHQAEKEPLFTSEEAQKKGDSTPLLEEFARLDRDRTLSTARRAQNGEPINESAAERLRRDAKQLTRVKRVPMEADPEDMALATGKETMKKRVPRELNARDIDNLRNTWSAAGNIEGEGSAEFKALAERARQLRNERYPELSKTIERQGSEVADMNRIKAAVGLKAGMSDTELSRVADALTKYGAKGNLENDRAIQMLLAEHPELAKKVEALSGMSAAERVRAYGTDGPTPMSKVGLGTHIARGLTGNAVGMDPIMRVLAAAKLGQYTVPAGAGNAYDELKKFQGEQQ